MWCVLHLPQFIDDILLKVLVLFVTAVLKLFLLFVEDELPDQAVVFQSVLLSFICGIDLFASVDSLSKVVIPAEWHWEYLEGVQKLSLEKFIRFHRNDKEYNTWNLDLLYFHSMSTFCQSLL